MTVLHIDKETRSAVDLRKTGVYVYAAHPTTDIWCIRFAIGDEPTRSWRPGQPVPADVVEHILLGGEVWAHNAQFERILWKYILGPRYGWPMPATEQFRCTMVVAYSMGLPGSLEMAAPAAGIEIGKDMSGRRVMLQVMKPRGKMKFHPTYLAKLGISPAEATWEHIPHDAKRVTQVNAEGWETYHTVDGQPLVEIRWWNDPEKIDRLDAYCGVDVDVERALEKRLRPLKKSELALWHLDQKINDRGVKVDRELAEAAIKIVERAEDYLDRRMNEVTNGEVSACSNRNQIVDYLQRHGVDTETIKKDVLEELLAVDSGIPGNVREVLVLRREAAKASVAKITALLRGESPEDGRAKGLLQFHAASTGRWGGRRFQPQNLKRPDEANIPLLIDVVASGDYDYVDMAFGEPLSAVGDILRGLIIAEPGHRIIAADYSNIEGRVLAWLAGEHWKMKAFADFDEGVGHDLYALAYARSYGISPESVMENKKTGDGSMRQIGKVMELALGYQGGVGAFVTMGANYGVDLPTHQVEEIRDAWREAHPNIKQFWRDMEDAAVSAVKEPGIPFYADRVMFKMSGSFLAMRLPSKRFLFYPYPEIRRFEVPWKKKEPEWVECASIDEAKFLYGEDMVQYDAEGKRALVFVNDSKDGLTYMSELDVSKRAKVVPDDRNTNKYGRIKTYGGMLAENATQGVARDILADAMWRLDPEGQSNAANYPIILTVHDEIVCEVPDGHGSVEEMEAIMCDLPDWAAGLPVAAEGFEDVRYRK